MTISNDVIGERWPETRAIALVALSAGLMPREVQRIGEADFDRQLS